MAQFLLKRGNLAQLNGLAIQDGQFIVVKDERAIYVDVGTERIRLGDFQEFATLDALKANTNPSTTALYYIKDINCLAKWDGENYIQINTDTGATSVEVVGEGNAVTAASYDAATRKLTLTKGVTFATKGEHDELANKVNALEVTGGQANVIETVKVNGVALEVVDKAVDVTVPTGALAGKDKVAEGDLEDALATKINGKLDASEVTGDLLTHNAAEFATAAQGALADTAVQPADIADMATNAGQKVITDALEGRIKANEDEFATHGDIVTHNVAEFATAAQGELAASALQAADKTELQGEIEAALTEAKKYADDNDADTTYGIEYVAGEKKIKLVAGGTNMEIDATAFIKDGMVSGVEIQEVEGVKNLVITFNTDAGKEAINVPLTQLVDIYTGVDGEEIKVVVSSDNKISAELKNGSITKERLSSGVQTSLALADSALQAQDISHLATEADLTLAEGRISDLEEIDHNAYVAADTALKNELQGKIDEIDNHSHANKALLDTYTQTEENLADAVAKKHTHTNEAELNKIVDGDVEKWNAAEQNAKDYADSAVEALGISDYLKKADTPGYEDILTKTDAATLYSVVGHDHDDKYDAKGAAAEAQTAAEATAAAALEAALTWGEF